MGTHLFGSPCTRAVGVFVHMHDLNEVSGWTALDWRQIFSCRWSS